MVNTRWVPPGKQTFVDDAGNPLVGGKVWTFIPNTSTPKTTWVDQARNAMNDNPLTLDARGQCTIWGDGLYSQLYTDAAGSQIWNQITGFVELEVATPAETAAGIRNDVFVSPYSLANASLFLPQIITPEQYGAVGNGVADDSDALEDFFADLPTKVGVMVGRYKITRLLNLNFTYFTLIGIPGYTKILGSFGYQLINMLSLANVDVTGIWFDNQYANAAFSGTGILQSNYDVSVINASFRRLKFTVPNANTRALMFFANTGAAAGTYIDGLWVEDCEFSGIGDLACTIMQRDPDPTLARRIYFNRNIGSDLGLIGTSGFLISLDGAGQEFTVDDNIVTNALGIGVEIANGIAGCFWRNGRVSGTRGSDFSRTWALISIDDGAVGNPNVNLDVVDNQTLEPATARTAFIGLDDSRLARNILEVSTGPAVEFRTCNRNNSNADSYISNGNLPLLISDTNGPSESNVWESPTLDNSAGAGFAGARFDGATTTLNEVRNPITNLSSTLADQTNGATGNIVHSARDLADVRTTRFGSFTMAADADEALSGSAALVAFDLLQINSAVPLTATRDVTLPVSIFVEASKIIWNNTAQTLRLVGPGGVGDSILSGTKRVVFYDLSATTYRVV